MATIIRDGDIVDVTNHNILSNNKIEQVNILQKVVTIGEKTINTDRNENGLYTQDVVSQDHTFTTATHNVSGNLVRIEAYTYSGSFDVLKSEYPLFSKDNIQWTLTGSRLYDYRPSASRCPNKHQMADDSVSCYVGRFGGESTGKYENFSQQGNWGKDGIVTLKLGNTQTKYNDNNYSYVTITEEETKYVVSYQIATWLVLMSSTGASGEYGRVYNFEEEVYYVSKIRFDLYVDGVTVSDETMEKHFGDKESFFKVSIDSNTLYQEQTQYNNETIATHNANKLLKEWKNGKESVEIDVIVGEYYDENGNLCISSQDNQLPMLFKIGDIVIPYVKKAEEIFINNQPAMVVEESGLSQYYNGEPKRFVVTKTVIKDDGVVLQKLTLVESAIAKEIKIETDSHTTITITRTSSDYDVPLGVLNELVVYDGDEITITATPEYSSTYLNLFLNGEPIANNESITVNDNIEIIAKATSMDNLTWAEISTLSQSGDLKKMYNTGDTKNFTYDDTDYTAVILDFDHDDLANGQGKAGVTFGLKGVLATKYAMANYNEASYLSWKDCYFRTNNVPTIFNALPAELRQVIKQITKTTLQSDTGIADTPQSSTDTLFLFSTDEVTTNRFWNSGEEGYIYPYFRNHLGVGIEPSTHWWLRSPSQDDTQKYYKLYTNESGEMRYGASDTAKTQNSISFGFCI